MPRDVVLTVEELSLSGSVSLGRCHKSTVKRWEKAVNEYLERNKYKWRVKGNAKDCSLSVIIN